MCKRIIWFIDNILIKNNFANIRGIKKKRFFLSLAEFIGPNFGMFYEHPEIKNKYILFF